MRSVRKLATIVALAWLAATVPGRAAMSGDEIKIAYASTKAALAPMLDELGVSDNPQAPQLKQREWSLEVQWIINDLNEHPAATRWNLKSVLQSLDSDFKYSRPSQVRLDDQTYLLALGDSVVIAAIRHDRYEIVWNLLDEVARPARGATRPRVDAASVASRWTAEEAMQGVGMTWAQVGGLPDTASGDHRFFIYAFQWQAAGAIGTYQLSIWRWHDRTATLELTGMHQDSQDNEPHFDGRYLHAGVRSNFKTLWACASCAGRELDWKILVEPDGVRDLGRASLTPELDLIDTLFDRIYRGRRAGDLATAAVLTKLTPIVAELAKDRRHQLSLLGELVDWSAKRSGNHATGCLTSALEAPGGDKSFAFTLTERKGEMIVSNVKDLGGTRCGK